MSDHTHDRGHTHSHSHGHDHGHDHPHDHHIPTSDTWRRDLAPGDGRGKIVFLDAPSGLAGDMIIAALIDLGVPPTVVEESVNVLPMAGFHVHQGHRTRSGIVATAFDVHVEIAQPERTYADICTLLDDSPLSPGVRRRAHATFRKLAESESKVHRMPLGEVHFHEVGAIDAIVDVVGSAAALEYLGAEVLVSPLPMGRGFIQARHGVLPLPAPATVACLAGFEMYDGGLEFEFVTPTGAAIVAAHATRSSRWPSMRPERAGWGAGTAELADRPNLLRAVLGSPSSRDDLRGDRTHEVLEANIDDATGELMGHCIETLMASGAVDAWITPIVMKKGRPAFTLSALAPVALADRVATAMLTESTSLGLRRYAVSRLEQPRHVRSVETPYGAISVKIAEGPFGPQSAKPEMAECLAAASKHKVPVRTVLAAAMHAAQCDPH